MAGVCWIITTMWFIRLQPHYYGTIGYYCCLRYKRNNDIGYCLDCRNWIWLYLGLDLTIGLSCMTEQCLVSKPSVWFWDLIWMWSDCVLDPRYLASIYAGILDLAICIWYLATCTWQWFLVLSWSSSFTWLHLYILLRYLVLFLHSSFQSILYSPASSPSILPSSSLIPCLSVLVFDKSSLVMLSS